MRHGAIASILKNNKVLLTALDFIQEGHDEYAAKGSGLLNWMEKFDTFFGLKLAHHIFAPAEQCSTNIQAVKHYCSRNNKGYQCAYFSSLFNTE